MTAKKELYDPDLSGKTKITYESIERMLINMFGSNRAKHFLDYDDVIDAINSSSYAIASRKLMYVLINIILEREYKLSENKRAMIAYEEYLEQIQKINNMITFQLADNKLSKKEKDKFISFDKVKKLLEDLEEKAHNRKNDYLDYMVVALYSLFPPRRVSDYALMKITDTDKGLDENFNYLYHKDGKMKFIFQNYKTKKNYGIQKFNVPDDLAKIINHWIETYIRDDEGFLISKDGGMKGYREKDLSKFVIRIFENNTNIPAGVSVLRHSFISDFSKQHRTLRERDEVASKMGHSIYLQLQYDRKDDDIEEI